MVYTIGGENFTRRKKIVLTGNLSGAQTDFQIKLAALAYAAAMQSDFDDLRFVKSDMQALIDAWLETKSDGSSADVWAEFPTTPANGVTQDYWMYYGNAGAASDWDIGATFVLGDHFPGASLDAGKWTSSGTIGVSSSEVTLDADDSIKSIAAWGYGYAVKTKAKADEQDSLFVKFCDEFGVGVGNALELYNTDYSNSDNFDSLSCSKLLSGVPTITLVDNQLDFRNVYRTYEITRDSTEAKYYQDDNLVHTHDNTGNYPTGNLSVGMNVWDSSQASTLIADWVFVRKYAASPPTASIGTEEHQRRTPQFM